MSRAVPGTGALMYRWQCSGLGGLTGMSFPSIPLSRVSGIFVLCQTKRCSTCPLEGGRQG